MTLPREFALIDRYFRPLAAPGARNLADDAAVIAVTPRCQLVISADAMNEGTHYLSRTSPKLIAQKLLRVNLSDLAAMGASPVGYLLTLAVPRDTADDWFSAFAEGLADDQRSFGISLLGGDSTSIDGSASLSLTILGEVPAGRAIGRDGAQPGDEIWVSGTVGDAALGLHVLRGELADPTGWLAQRYLLPTPRLNLANGLAHAAIDISDGLLAEISHLCRASGLAAEIARNCIPFSPAVHGAGPAWADVAMQGGDDYELILAIPPASESALIRRAGELGVMMTRIGKFVPGDPELRVDGRPTIPTGWSHFAS